LAASACDAGAPESAEERRPRVEYPDTKAPLDPHWDDGDKRPEEKVEGDGEGSSGSADGGPKPPDIPPEPVAEAPDPRPVTKKKKKIRFPKSGKISKEDPAMQYNPAVQQEQIREDLEQMDKKLDDVLKGLDGL